MNRIDFLKKIVGVGFLGMIGKQTNKCQITNTYDATEIYRSYVRGLIYSPGKVLIKNLIKDTPINMIREPKNEYDDFAIALYVQNQKIGYVPAEDNIILSNLLHAKHGRYTAEITAINHDAPHWEQVEFRIMSHQSILT